MELTRPKSMEWAGSEETLHSDLRGAIVVAFSK